MGNGRPSPARAVARRLPVLLLAAACGAPGATSDPAPAAPAAAAAWLDDATAASGLDVVHDNGMSGRFFDTEVFGPGVGLFDYDNDGDLDAVVVQGIADPAATGVPAGAPPFAVRLFRNDLAAAPGGAPGARFTDVTAGSGLSAAGYGMGVATADVNNDGWADLYVTNVGPNQLFLNNGDGTFRDVSRRAGVADPSWSVSASFADVDRDGWQDLYVGNYLAWSAATDRECFHETGTPDYCAPTVYQPAPDRFYRNRGDGTFEDATARALRGGTFGPALGVIAADLTGDGWVDVYVANDGRDNLLWVNQRDGTFADGALLAGAAVNAAGRPEASMGVDAGDADQDGDEDLFLTHWAGEKNTLYVQTAPGVFEDRTAGAGLGPPSVPFTGFGTGWFDLDNDGWLDLFVANGAVIRKEALVRAGDPFPLHEPNHLYRNRAGRFELAGHVEALAVSEVSRGAAFGDVDNDGDVDLLVGNNNGRARLLLNGAAGGRHWVGLSLIDRHGHRAGATVTVVSSGRTLVRRARADGSYASANDPRVVVGLGGDADPPAVRVQWPSGRVEQWPDVALDAWTTLREGTGR